MTEETKKCAKCGKELCDECVCEDDATMCKDCCGDGDSAKGEDCEHCADKACCAGDKKE